jgi:formylglycine-generating enzyme
VVVSVGGEEACAKPVDWTPNRSICDADGSIQKKMDVHKLPQSFLYSWDSTVSMTAHEVDPIEKAVQDYLRNTQLRMVVDGVEVIGDKYAMSHNPELLRREITGFVREYTKFDVVSESDVRVPRVAESTCEASFPPNSTLRITVQGDERGDRRLTVSLEKDGCVLASATEAYKGRGLDEDTGSLEIAAKKAVARLFGGLVRLRKPLHIESIVVDRRETQAPPAKTGVKVDSGCRNYGGKTGWMCGVPAGEFMMGCSPKDTDCGENESPFHRVRLSAYLIDKYEVTAGQYEKCVSTGACTPAGQGTHCTYQAKKRGEYPINCVEWDQASEYCKWAGKRLPTEAEWEKAARGSDGRVYPWGDSPLECSRLVYGGEECKAKGTAPVGSKPYGVSPFGLMDMLGNVWEWVYDWYGAKYYETSPNGDPAGPATGEKHIARGGSFRFKPLKNMRISYREPEAPGFERVSFGFRCVKQ